MALFGDRDKILPILRSEEKAETPTSPDGVYGTLKREGGFVLLLGVGQNSNTYLHAVEEMLLGNDRLCSSPTPMKVRRESGEVTTRSFYELDEAKWGDVSHHFSKLEEAFCHWGAISRGQVGNADATLCDAEKMFFAMEKIYRNTDGRQLYWNDAPLRSEWYEK